MKVRVSVALKAPSPARYLPAVEAARQAAEARHRPRTDPEERE